MTHAPHGRLPRSCMELGVCQSRTPACNGCDHPAREKLATPPAPMRLAPGVIDGPYRRETSAGRALQEAANALQLAKDALRLVTAYLTGPHP